MAESPSSRTIKWGRENGLIIGNVERYVYQVKKKYDLYGFIDIVGVASGYGTFGIQATSGSNMNARIAKICDGSVLQARSDLLISEGWRILVVGWRKLNPQKGRSHWAPRWAEIDKGGHYRVLPKGESPLTWRLSDQGDTNACVSSDEADCRKSGSEAVSVS